jgi:hypothetical protein
MPGGLLQLAAIGSADLYLTGNPQITFFKCIFRRSTNFALETMRNNFPSTCAFGAMSTLTIERTADLIYKTYVRVVISAGTAPAGAQWAWVRNLGHALLQTVELQIGGQRIDYHTSDYYQLHSELQLNAEQERGYAKLIGNVPELTTLNPTHDSYTLYIPMRFFYDKHVGQALPLVALQHQDVKLNIRFEDLNNLLVTTGFAPGVNPGDALGLKITDATVECGMVYLDTDERRRFSQLSHEILIEQVQWNGLDNITKVKSQLLAINHPVKELIWGIHTGRMANTGGKYQYLWYDSDNDTLRLIATKRFVLACALYDDNGNLILSNTATDTNSILPCVGLSGDLLTMFTNIQASAVATTPSVYNVAILGDLLSLEDVSTPVSVLLSGLTRPTSGDGAAINDVIVRMPHNFGVYLDGTGNPLYQANVTVSGQDRFKLQDAMYFNYLQPYEHHTRTPSDGINVYSFALLPEEQQPSGTMNFSRLDQPTLQMYLNDKYMDAVGTDSLITVYAVSYNVLRIMSGMAGIAFAV